MYAIGTGGGSPCGCGGICCCGCIWESENVFKQSVQKQKVGIGGGVGTETEAEADPVTDIG